MKAVLLAAFLIWGQPGLTAAQLKKLRDWGTPLVLPAKLAAGFKLTDVDFEQGGPTAPKYNVYYKGPGKALVTVSGGDGITMKSGHGELNLSFYCPALGSGTLAWWRQHKYGTGYLFIGRYNLKGGDPSTVYDLTGWDIPDPLVILPMVRSLRLYR